MERGGKCGFVDKVKNMMVSGASAVVVGDFQKGPLVTMYSNRGKTLVLSGVWMLRRRSMKDRNVCSLGEEDENFRKGRDTPHAHVGHLILSFYCFTVLFSFPLPNVYDDDVNKQNDA